MKHFIVTRFNLKVEDWKTAKDGSIVLTDKWLEERFKLFQKYCLPSVINQKNQNFYWLVFFDIETPVAYKKMIDRIAGEYKKFVPLYIDSNNSLQPSFKKYILEHIKDDDLYIITSRLDNDDAIHENFVDIIQKIAIQKKDTVIDIRMGYQMDISDNSCKYRRLYNSFNPFISLVENTKNFNTIISRKHQDWKNSDSILVYDKDPLWIEIIHKKNKLNSVRSNIPLIKEIKLKEFGIARDEKKLGSFFIFKNNFYVVLRKIKNVFQQRKIKFK